MKKWLLFSTLLLRHAFISMDEYEYSANAGSSVTFSKVEVEVVDEHATHPAAML